MSRAYWAGAALGRAVIDRLNTARRAQRGAPAHEGWDTPTPATRASRPSETPPTASRTPEEERIARFMDRFCHYREDYARQWVRVGPDGRQEAGWARVGKTQPERCALTPDVVQAHLYGRISVGTYLLDERGTCRLLVLDHDDKRMLPEIEPATGQRRIVPEDGLLLLHDCRQRLAEQGIASAISESRRGGHLFVFLAEPVPARDARALAMLALGRDEVDRMARGEEAFEVYPKQDRRGERDGSVGANIALPLGVHLKDGQRHPFIDRHGESVAPTLSGQLDYLQTIAPCRVREVLRDREWLYEALDRAMHPQRPREREMAAGRTPERERVEASTLLGQVYQQSPWAPPPPAPRPLWQNDGRPGLIARWKEAVDCRDVVQSYGVQLDHNGVGRCPFHDDQHASFQAWPDGWRCYAENRGGDALHFVMEQEGMSPKDALAYVRERFPVPGVEITEGHPSGRA